MGRSSCLFSVVGMLTCNANQLASACLSDPRRRRSAVLLRLQPCYSPITWLIRASIQTPRFWHHAAATPAAHATNPAWRADVSTESHRRDLEIDAHSRAWARLKISSAALPSDARRRGNRGRLGWGGGHGFGCGRRKGSHSRVGCETTPRPSSGTVKDSRKDPGELEASAHSTLAWGGQSRTGRRGSRRPGGG